jgi:hypothetical protein
MKDISFLRLEGDIVVLIRKQDTCDSMNVDFLYVSIRFITFPLSFHEIQFQILIDRKFYCAFGMSFLSKVWFRYFI